MSKRKKRSKYADSIDAKDVMVDGESFKLRKLIKPRSQKQSEYLDSLYTKCVTVCVGPAGTGKTYLAISAALKSLMANKCNKIFLTRPVVEAGEHLGFLPGTLQEKLDPYLLPLLDAIQDQIGIQMCNKLIETGKIEIAPLAYMRGRSINNAFVICDESQNTTIDQMRMFITRIGFKSHFVIDGDITQSDLDKPRSGYSKWESGLEYIFRKLNKNDPDIGIIEFDRSDVVRSEIVKKILSYIQTDEATEEKYVFTH